MRSFPIFLVLTIIWKPIKSDLKVSSPVINGNLISNASEAMPEGIEFPDNQNQQNPREFDDEEKVESLCENPFIHSADRLVNGTIRVYRGNYYWELVGLPSEEATAVGPLKIWWKFMAPFKLGHCTHTILNGVYGGIHMKYVGQYYWHWWPNGAVRRANLEWPYFPKGGFNAVFHDGGLTGEGPMLVALGPIKTYYYSTDTWAPIGSRDGYRDGRFDENYPPDVTAAFSWPAEDVKIKYYVYLFKKDKYCFRPMKAKKGEECPEWRDSRKLFGCYRKNGDNPDVPSNAPQEPPKEGPPKEEPNPDTNPDPAQVVDLSTQSSNSYANPILECQIIFVSLISLLVFILRL